MMIGPCKIERRYKTLKPKKSMCHDCRENFYNGNNPYSIKECWHFKTAVVVDAHFYPGPWATDKQMILVKKTLNCFCG